MAKGGASGEVYGSVVATVKTRAGVFECLVTRSFCSKPQAMPPGSPNIATSAASCR